MTVEPEPNKPNEAGFAGDPSTPQPDRTRESTEETEAEGIAVPAGDLTGPITEALEPHKD
jgi:hypothetical protein